MDLLMGGAVTLVLLVLLVISSCIYPDLPPPRGPWDPRNWL